MRELAVQSSNGIYDDPIDRGSLELEFQQLFREIDDIASTTTFNNIKLLDGSHSSAVSTKAKADEVIILGEGSSLSGVDFNPELSGSAGLSWTSIGGKDLTGLRNSIINDYAPSSVDSILNSLSSAYRFLSDFNIGIGIGHSNLGGASAAVGWSFGIQGGTHFIQLRLVFDTDYLNSVTDASGNFRNADVENQFKSVVAHEMMHAVMAVANTYGMSSVSGGGFQSSQFPMWFREGMAQAVSGPVGWLNSLGTNPSDTQINNFMSNLPTGTSSSHGQGIYGAGYVAAMYLGHAVGIAESGVASLPNSENIRRGLEIIMQEITAGKSLDQAIADNSSFSGLSSFQNQLRSPNAEIRDFVRNLITATGSGTGSILGDLDETMTAILNKTTKINDFLKVNPDAMIIKNTYPPEYTVISGGGATISGVPIGPGAPDPIGDIRPGAQAPPDNIEPGFGGSFSTFIMQVGANSGDTMAIHIGSISTMDIGLTGASIATQEVAQEAITTVNDAINIVSLRRAGLGAYQNRLEFKIQNLDNSAENLTASESRIRDADMAKLMSEFTKNNILMQASTTMLAQANALPQGVLSLLN